MRSLKNYFIVKWDNFIYEMAYPSFDRILRRNSGICYLFVLHLESWLRQNPLTPELKQATEEFFQEHNEHIERTKGK